MSSDWLFTGRFLLTNVLIPVHSGTLRADHLFPAGDLLMKDLKKILPIFDELILLECTG